MASEYDPIVPRPELTSEPSDLEQVQYLFEKSAERFLRSPWSWIVWALVVAGACSLTRQVASAAGPWGVVFLWSLSILVGGMGEALIYFRHSRTRDRTRSMAPSKLVSWVLRNQGNLSFVAIALSLFLVWKDLGHALPGLWLLTLGHSLFAHGGLGSPAFRVTGGIYQAAGIVALLPIVDPLLALAVGVGLGNLWMAIAVQKR